MSASLKMGTNLSAAEKDATLTFQNHVNKIYKKRNIFMQGL